MSGTIKAIIPAVDAERTPLKESSKAKHSPGLTPRYFAAVRNGSGAGLPPSETSPVKCFRIENEPLRVALTTRKKQLNSLDIPEWLTGVLPRNGDHKINRIDESVL